ncbi:flagellin N-terminal helical domain-containing protein [Butyrivibrio sp. MC2013]|uniref:flagellin N-terminal helical domain-containing protein n=1 Tax=Butyrivibrio sp. MC2013 TaxID=1280686 RepID=UPI000428F17E|nr:flagellin [Butyrivibrio sp. MC2013]
MRITNRIMQNNSMFNINNNKNIEDNLNTQIATGKKLTRPSDDPVIAIRALRLRSNVTELSQYYEKNAKDAESWLDVTQDSLSTVTDVLTALIQQANKGVNQYEKLEDVQTILTEMAALSDEYYSTGNENYAGRYIFTGYRTDTALTFPGVDTSYYEDINDEFNAGDLDKSTRLLGAYKLAAGDNKFVAQSDISSVEVGRLRLSYDNLETSVGPDKDYIADIALRFRESMNVSATTKLYTLDEATTHKKGTQDALNIIYQDAEGVTHKACIPTTENKIIVDEPDGTTTSYVATRIDDFEGKAKGYTISIENVSKSGEVRMLGTVQLDKNGVLVGGDKSGAYEMGVGKIKAVTTSISTLELSEVSFTPGTTGESVLTVPLPGASESPYKMVITGTNYIATVNTDGTYQITDEKSAKGATLTTTPNVVNLASNGSIHSSYIETVLKPGIELDDGTIVQVIDQATTEAKVIDEVYEKLANMKGEGEYAYVVNSTSGEVLLSEALRQKLGGLGRLVNANTIDVVYDKSAWETGDIRPENLMKCRNVDNGINIQYNGGNADHIMKYDVGYGQEIPVNTTADEVFTTAVKRNVEDLQRIVDQMTEYYSMLNTMKETKSAETDPTKKDNIQKEIDAVQKVYDNLKNELKEGFGNKITGFQEALNKANVAVTENGTRSRRLSMIQSRLQNQLTTFKTLQSDNEDIDLAEVATNLSTAELTYQSSLMATSKIMSESLMKYI